MTKYRHPMTWVITFNRGDGSFELAVVHETSRDKAIEFARGTIEVATWPIEEVRVYGPENIGAMFAVTYRPVK